MLLFGNVYYYDRKKINTYVLRMSLATIILLISSNINQWLEIFIDQCLFILRSSNSKILKQKTFPFSYQMIFMPFACKEQKPL